MEPSNGNTPLPEDTNKAPEGVVVPPKDIRGTFLFFPFVATTQLISYLAIVEKTAGYVSRNGAVFEGILSPHPLISR
jgi:splicing factor 3A subunit 1